MKNKCSPAYIVGKGRRGCGVSCTFIRRDTVFSRVLGLWGTSLLTNAGAGLAPTTSWSSVLQEIRLPCKMKDKAGSRIDPAIHLRGIGQFADAASDLLLRLTMWLAKSVLS
jgi:hypothetical protein